MHRIEIRLKPLCATMMLSFATGSSGRLTITQKEKGRDKPGQVYCKGGGVTGYEWLCAAGLSGSDGAELIVKNTFIESDGLQNVLWIRHLGKL